jgi:hypothetical protein
MSKTSRAKQAGESLAETIMEMVNLMYQMNTATNFLEGLGDRINFYRLKISKEYQLNKKGKS